MVKAARVSVLILLLACSAQAGYMPSGVSAPSASPTPTPAPSAAFEAEPAEDATADGVADALAEAALSVLDNMLALL